VLCYEVTAQGQAIPKAQIKHDMPVLCSAWNHDGTAVFSGGCDNQVKKWDLATNTPTQVAQHDAPVRHLSWIPDVNLLVTGGWDKTLKYWAGAYTRRLFSLNVSTFGGICRVS
jgi:mRNA export factor